MELAVAACRVAVGRGGPLCDGGEPSSLGSGRMFFVEWSLLESSSGKVLGGGDGSGEGGGTALGPARGGGFAGRTGAPHRSRPVGGIGWRDAGGLRICRKPCIFRRISSGLKECDDCRSGAGCRGSGACVHGGFLLASRRSSPFPQVPFSAHTPSVFR